VLPAPKLCHQGRQADACSGAVADSGWHLTVIPRLQALTAGFFFNAAKLQRSGNYRTIKNKQTVHMHPQNGLSEVRREPTNLSQCAAVL
jgi:hypothetical protein